MSENIKSDMMSRRRALSLLGLGGALSLVGSSILSASEAEAQETAPGATPSTGVGTPGMKRRQQRRAGRHERRHERRTGQPAGAAPAGAAAPAGTAPAGAAPAGTAPAPQ
jgi:hypothetical protein